MADTILLAEDDPLVRNLAIDLLEAAGYRVLVARDGAEAESIIRDGAAEFQAAVFDVMMPHRNGRQVYDTLRSVRPHVPVVFCTGGGYADVDDLETISGRAV